MATTVSGTSITIALDGTQIASLSTTSWPAQYASGTVGFREYAGEEADFRDLSVTSGSSTLYSNALSSQSSLSAFAVPGVNSLASIVDGAKRDRAIWAGDMNVEGPTVYPDYGVVKACFVVSSG